MLHTLVSSHSELRDKKTRTVQNVSPSVFLYQVRACSKQIQVPQTFWQVSHPLLPPVPLLWHSYISTGTHREKKGTEEYHVGKTMTKNLERRTLQETPSSLSFGALMYLCVPKFNRYAKYAVQTYSINTTGLFQFQSQLKIPKKNMIRNDFRSRSIEWIQVP
jgi:hypothetical protein